MKISLCVITLNEELNLDRCLRSCATVVDEMVVLDSGSVDATEEIARRHGARFERQEWPGYGAQKNRAIDLAGSPWVLSLDADEELSPELIAEIRQWKSAASEPEANGFSMPRCVLYEGRWIRHGDWYPDRLTRLFRKSHGRFVEARVHERLEVPGPVIRLSGELYHYSFRDAADHWARCEKYARLWAEAQRDAGRRAGPLAPAARAAFRWLRGYVARRGFLDGRQGWRIAAYCAREVHLKYSLLRQMTRSDPKERS
jgi:glycosyltransferase involved in cell wall biosynthesis